MSLQVSETWLTLKPNNRVGPKEGCNWGHGLSAAIKRAADKPCPQLQPSLVGPTYVINM